MFGKPAPHIIFLAYISIFLAWTLSLIITLAAATKLHVSRIPILCCYLGRSILSVIEFLWYERVFDRIEKGLWSRNATRDNSDFSSYEEINRYPSLLFGYKRAAATVSATIIFLCSGATSNDRRWALWFGCLLLGECILRSIFAFCWFILPRHPKISAWLGQRISSMVSRWMEKFTRQSRPWRSSHERVPFQEDLAQPFRETWSGTWNAYMSILSMPRLKTKHRLDRADR